MIFMRSILITVLLTVGFILSGQERLTVRYDDRSGLASTLVGGGVTDSCGLLWLATWNGLNCYDGYDFHWVKIRPGDGASISTNHLRDILLSERGNIICRTDEGIHEFDLSTYTFHDIEPHAIDSLRKVMGRKWHGLTDRQGNRWTADLYGLYKCYSPHHPAHVIEGTEGGHPRSLLVGNDGRLWVGLRKSREIRVYSEDGSLSQVIPLRSAPYCIFQTGQGDVWVGCKPGALFRIGGESITDDAVYDIKEDRQGRLWVATFGEGVKCCPDPNADRPHLSESFGGCKVRKLLITEAGNLVAATDDGLMIGHIDSQDYSKTQLRSVRRDGNDAGSLCCDATMSLAQDGAGNIYVGTRSSGVDVISEESLFSEHPVFVHLNRQESTLPSDVCNAMTFVADTLLMIVGSDNVMAYNPQSGQTVNFGNAFWADTCRFAETTPVILEDGTWVLGADEGAFQVTPQQVNTRGYIPPVVFTTLAVNGGADEFCLARRKVVELQASERNVTVGFAAIDYVDNSGILYRTRVDGSPWTPADRNRSVTLFNMSSGTHELEVQSTDRYGRWVENTGRILVTVEPYWHETWWARTLFVLLAIAITGGGVAIWLYVRNVRLQRAELFDKYMALLNERDATDGSVECQEEEIRPISPGQKAEDAVFLNRVRRYIEENIANPDANIDEMAAAAASSRSTLNRHLRSQLGVSAAQLLIEARMQRADQLLRSNDMRDRSVAEIAAMCGYSDARYFQRVFKKRHGIGPAEYKMSCK